MSLLPDFRYDDVQKIYSNTVLSKYCTFPPALRVEQAKCIHAMLLKKDLLSILPTGYGKTICAICPGIIRAKLENRISLTLIISPLIALMEDTAARINRYGVKAVYWTSNDFSEQGTDDLKSSMTTYEAGFILASPESLAGARVKDLLRKMNPDFVCVDEGHVAVLWGDKFRKDYAVIYDLRSFTDATFGVFTATITPEILHDVKRRTGLVDRNLTTVAVVPERSEIFLDLRTGSRNIENLGFALDELKSLRELSSKYIIYVNNISVCTEIFLWFRKKLGDVIVHSKSNFNVGFLVNMYTSCTEEKVKDLILTEFSKPDGYLRVVIATIAFGLGVDIPNVRNVVVWGSPSDYITIWQEIGRAARDGKKGRAIIFPNRQGGGSKGRIFLPVDKCLRVFLLSKFVMSGLQVKPLRNVHDCCSYCSGQTLIDRLKQKITGNSAAMDTSK